MCLTKKVQCLYWLPFDVISHFESKLRMEMITVDDKKHPVDVDAC